MNIANWKNVLGEKYIEVTEIWQPVLINCTKESDSLRHESPICTSPLTVVHSMQFNPVWGAVIEIKHDS